jgi:hypothetical protein
MTEALCDRPAGLGSIARESSRSRRASVFRAIRSAALRDRPPIGFDRRPTPPLDRLENAPRKGLAASRAFGFDRAENARGRPRSPGRSSPTSRLDPLGRRGSIGFVRAGIRCRVAMHRGGCTSGAIGFVCAGIAPPRGLVQPDTGLRTDAASRRDGRAISVRLTPKTAAVTNDETLPETTYGVPSDWLRSRGKHAVLDRDHPDCVRNPHDPALLDRPGRIGFVCATSSASPYVWSLRAIAHFRRRIWAHAPSNWERAGRLAESPNMNVRQHSVDDPEIPTGRYTLPETCSGLAVLHALPPACVGR